MTQSAESTLKAGWRRPLHRLWRSMPEQMYCAGAQRGGTCMVPAVNYVRLSGRSTSSSGAQRQSRWRVGDDPCGGQPVDRRLWTVQYGAARVNLLHAV